jgi:WD40 repeat protein
MCMIGTVFSFTQMLLLVVALAGPMAGMAGGSQIKPAKPEGLTVADPDRERLPKGVIVRLGSMRLRHAGVQSVVFLPDGTTLLSVGRDRWLRYWNFESGEQVQQIKLQGNFSSIWWYQISPGGKTVAGLSSDSLVVWDARTGQLLKSYKCPDYSLPYVSFSPNGKSIAISSQFPNLTLWELDSGSQRSFPLRSSLAESSSHCGGNFSPDGKWLVAGGGFQEDLNVFEVSTGRKVHALDCYAPTTWGIAPDNKRLAVFCVNISAEKPTPALKIYDLASGKLLAVHAFPYRSVAQTRYWSLEFSPDGERIALGGAERGNCVVEASSGHVLYGLSGTTGGLTFSQDGKKLVGLTGSLLRVWDAETGWEFHQRNRDFDDPESISITVAPDGQRVAVASGKSHQISIWDLKIGRLVRAIPRHEDWFYWSNLAFSGDGKAVMASDDGGLIHKWSSQTGRELDSVQVQNPDWTSQIDPNPFGVPDRPLQGLHLTADGKYVSRLDQVPGRIGSMRLTRWDAVSGKCLSQRVFPSELLPDGLDESIWSRDARKLAIRQEHGFSVVAVDTGKIAFRVTDLNPDAGPLPRPESQFASSPTFRLLAIRDVMKTGQAPILIWEVASGRLLTSVLTPSRGPLALTPDDRSLVTIDDGAVCLIDLETGKVCGRWPLPEPGVSAWGNRFVKRLIVLPEGQKTLVCLEDGTALVYDLSSALPVKNLRLTEPRE